MIFQNNDPDAQYFRTGEVDDINDTFYKFVQKRRRFMRFGEAPSGFNVSDMVRAFGQATIWRCVELIEEANRARLNGSGLTSLILSRAAHETVAYYYHTSQTLEKLLDSPKSQDDIDQVHDFIRRKTFATKLTHHIHAASQDGVDVSAQSILSSINKLDKKHSGARKQYDHLSEFAHPNHFGLFGWYGEPNSRGAQFHFKEQKPEHRATVAQGVANSVALLRTLDERIETVNELLPALSNLGHSLLK